MSGLKNVKILFFIKRTKLLKNGEAPIFVRITINKERTEFAAKKSLKPKYWSEVQEKAKRTAPDSEDINETLNKKKKNVSCQLLIIYLTKKSLSRPDWFRKDS
jgi:hypothetical protein